LRHKFGVYRFYTEGVYAGEWLNGQSRSSLLVFILVIMVVDLMESSSGGVKHGLSHYHFRYIFRIIESLLSIAAAPAAIAEKSGPLHQAASARVRSGKRPKRTYK